MNRTILHVDMDAYFAAVEQRDHPELRGLPVIVGSDPKGGKGRGIVATCSYEARKFGVHSAQPISQAWRLCPHGTYLRPGMAKYERVSHRIMAVLIEFTDLVEQVSIDEAFLDVTGCRRLHGSGAEIALKVKQRIRQETQLTASVGVASNKFVAKVASDLEKPDGLVVVHPGREKEFLEPLPINRLWGVGRKTEACLLRLGFRSIGQIAAAERAALAGRLGSAGSHLWELANGIDDRPVCPEEGYKSIGHETTFERDIDDREELHDTLLELTEKVTRRLRSHGVAGHTLTVKYREADFSTYTRRQTLASAASTTPEIFPAAWKLLQGLMRKGRRVRLIGVSISNLGPSRPDGQLHLFEASPAKGRRLAEAMDDITNRFGPGAITRADLVPRK